MIELDDVRAAAERIREHVHVTPVLTSRTLDERVGAARVHLKAENLQRGGAFKIRGASSKIRSLTPEELRGGVAAYSSGNHAQAVALAARDAGTRAVVLMPEDAPASKLEAARGYGAEVVLYDRYTEDREELGAKLAAERGMTMVPPYEDPLVMAGQGTAALELFEAVGELDVLLVPMGGGGLMAGSATVAKALAPRCRVVGIEPDYGDDHRRSFEVGRRVAVDAPRGLADGLLSSIPGQLTFEVNRRLVDDVVIVTDAEIVDAMVFAFERLKTVVEPSGAVALAALLTRRIDVGGMRVGAILSGGNVSPQRFAELVSARSS